MTKRWLIVAVGLLFGGISALSAQGRSQSAPADASGTYLLMTGTVLLEDGSPAPQTIQAELVCNGQIMRQDMLDAKGQFEFEMGSLTARGMTDTTATTFGDVRSISRGEDVTMAGNRSAGGGFSSPSLGRVQLQGCEIRVPSIPGFVSQSITLSTRSTFDDPDVGTIVLQRARSADPAVVTLTTLAAPPEAQNAYVVAYQELQKGQPDHAAAAKSLEKAVEIYPEFALAWNKLAEVRVSSKDLDGARQAYQKAADCDPDYLGPVLGLAKMEMDAGHWEQAGKLTAQAVKKAPDNPQCLYFNGIINYNLKRFAPAKKDFLTIKQNGHLKIFPMTSFFLAMIHTMQGDLSAAAPEFRLYLENTPEENVPAKLRDWITNKLQEWEASGKIKTTS